MARRNCRCLARARSASIRTSREYAVQQEHNTVYYIRFHYAKGQSAQGGRAGGMRRANPLYDVLAVAVPLALQDLAAQGGPTRRHWEAAQAWRAVLASKGDQILFRGKETATLVA